MFTGYSRGYKQPNSHKDQIHDGEVLDGKGQLHAHEHDSCLKHIPQSPEEVSMAALALYLASRLVGKKRAWRTVFWSK